MFAYCGLDCERCEAFIATKYNDGVLRVSVAAKWAKLYHAPIKPEHINCTGCKSAGVKTYYCDQLCGVRKCATKRSVQTCADCSDYPCATLNELLKTSPAAKLRLEALRGK